jgi:hypothetical protein
VQSGIAIRTEVHQGRTQSRDKVQALRKMTEKLVGTYQKCKIQLSTPISVYRCAGTAGAFAVTDTLTSISCDLYMNGAFSTALTVTTNNTSPITKSFNNPNATVTNYNYNQYYTNAYVTFTPTENLTSNTTYTLYFNKLVFSSSGVSATYGYYLNTDISDYSASGVIIAQSPSGIGYEVANYSPSYNGVSHNSNGTVFSNEYVARNTFTDNLESTILNTATLQVNSATTPNYDSGWSQVSANSTYTKAHNLGWALPFPPTTIRIFFSTVVNPVLGTNNIYEISSVNTISGLYNNTTNLAYGINHIRHLNSNSILISTANNGVFYSSGGEDVSSQSSGYYRIYMYR